MRSKTPATQLPVDPREPVDRDPQLGAREEERRHRRRERRQGRQGRELAQLDGVGRRRQRPVHAVARTARPRRSRSRRTRSYWGAKKSPWTSVVVRNMIAATQLLNVRPRLARDRDRPLRRPGAVAEGELERQRLAAAVDLGLLAVRERQPEGLGGHVEQELPEGDPLRARLQVDRRPRRPGRDPGARASSRRCSSARCPQSDAVKTDVAKAKAALQASGVGEPAGDADLSERPDDQRRPVHVDGAEGAVEPARRSAST